MNTMPTGEGGLVCGVGAGGCSYVSLGGIIKSIVNV